jgi:hypothetical protein
MQFEFARDANSPEYTRNKPRSMLFALFADQKTVSSYGFRPRPSMPGVKKSPLNRPGIDPKPFHHARFTGPEILCSVFSVQCSGFIDTDSLAPRSIIVLVLSVAVLVLES